MHSPHPPCVRNAHAPSLNYCICHNLATNRDILLAFVWNHSQGNTVWPTARTPTPNSLRSSWDFLPGRSPDMLAGLAPSTFLVLEGGPYDKLCPLILFWTFARLSWILSHSPLHDVFSHAKTLNITREFFDLFSKFTYDGEDEVAWPEYLEDFY